MIRAAGPHDRAEVEARLKARIDGAMFPLANLRAHGVGDGGFASDHPHATRFWLSGDDGVIALTREGTVLPVLGEVAPLGTLRDALAGLLVAGVVGQARSARRGMGNRGQPALPGDGVIAHRRKRTPALLPGVRRLRSGTRRAR